MQYNKNRIDVKDSLKIIFRDTNSFFKVGRVIQCAFAIYLDLFVCLFVEKNNSTSRLIKKNMLGVRDIIFWKAF